MDKSDKVKQRESERDDREMGSQEQQTGHQKTTAWYTQTDTGWGNVHHPNTEMSHSEQGLLAGRTEDRARSGVYLYPPLSELCPPDRSWPTIKISWQPYHPLTLLLYRLPSRMLHSTSLHLETSFLSWSVSKLFSLCNRSTSFSHPVLLLNRGIQITNWKSLRKQKFGF